ncbi:tRNA epoxyqueuosine(34) reductase QueG [Carboxylicivirga caseinilyticus]|uniref:tRNA epoxyqueuosine(34) reductase QueG n=1 Tax=Carboxylicivirga caseinilyticus TaxID=3417572 RepID=UPI003D357585|nr:tRNA epoxyqueuosine(34) reductase QueG [Marinilabiliaceae bacterium A049]
MHKTLSSKQLIINEALRLGFSDIGFSTVEHLAENEIHLKEWLDNGFHAGMSYMENHFEKRINPALLVEGSTTVVSVLLNYKPKLEQSDPEAPKLARYAYGKDYHFVIKDKLQLLFDYIKSDIYPDLEGRMFTDSAPVLDRAWAVNSGLGWIGKNTNLIHKKLGSFVLIGELIINMEIEPDTPIKEACGGCTRCIDACPTKALIGPYQLDSNKCISYLTIEHREEIPEEFKGKFENWAFGCDICQEACPWNWKARPTSENEFQPHPDLLQMTNDQWHNLDEDRFTELFRKSAVKRTKYKGLKRNLDFLKKK